MALTRKQKRALEEKKKKNRFWKDLPLYVIMFGLFVGAVFLARWLLEWEYYTSIVFAALAAEFFLFSLSYGIFRLAKATGAKTKIRPKRCLGFAISGLAGCVILIICLKLIGWQEWVGLVIAVPIVIVIIGLTLLVSKVEEFMMMGQSE